MPEPPSLPPDLWVQLPADVLDRVEHALGARLDRDALVRKRRSVGTTTDRATWVRIESGPRKGHTGKASMDCRPPAR